MKVAVLSDIHANNFALSAVLKEIEFHNINIIIIAGDFVGYYFWPKETLELLNLNEIIAIKGNHEEILFDIIDGKKNKIEVIKKYGSGILEAINCLDDKQIDWLRNLPTSRSLQINNKKITISHGSPWDPNLYIYPDAKKSIIDRCFSENEDIIILGHTHYQMLHRKNDRILLNPGSVGQPRDGKVGAQWSLLDLDTLEVKFFCTKYDNSIIKDEVLKRHKEMKILSKSLYEIKKI